MDNIVLVLCLLTLFTIAAGLTAFYSFILITLVLLATANGLYYLNFIEDLHSSLAFNLTVIYLI